MSQRYAWDYEKDENGKRFTSDGTAVKSIVDKEFVCRCNTREAASMIVDALEWWGRNQDYHRSVVPNPDDFPVIQ